MVGIGPVLGGGNPEKLANVLLQTVRKRRREG